MIIQHSISNIKILLLILVTYSCQDMTTSDLEVSIKATKSDWSSIRVCILNHSDDAILFAKQDDSYFASQFSFLINDNDANYKLIAPEVWTWAVVKSDGILLPKQKVTFNIDMISLFRLHSDSDSLQIQCIFQNKFNSNLLNLPSPSL